jgi:hypothetical protein
MNEETRIAYKTLVRQPERKIQLGDLGVDWRMILKVIFRKQNVDWIHLAQDWASGGILRTW